MIEWKAFSHCGETYDLSHLWPDLWNYEQPANKNKQAKIYRIKITYSLHCFTKGKEDHHDPLLGYADARETRTFCVDRHKHSYGLPEIIRNIGNGYVLHTGHRNFLRVDIGNSQYEVYFSITRSTENEVDLHIYVQSAYVRTHGGRPKAGKIRFTVIAFNTLHNKPIKPIRR
jgi:hypothetical protein